MRRAALLVIVTTLAACGISVVGIDPLPIIGSEPDARASSSSSSSGSSGATDAGAEAASCVPTTPLPALARKKKIDPNGKDDDWKDVPAIAFDAQTCGVGSNERAPKAKASVAVAWQDEGIYALVRVELGRAPAGDSDTPWMNDGAEIYLGGTARDDGTITNESDIHLIVDRANRAFTYYFEAPTPAADRGIKTAVAEEAGGFFVEVFVPRELLGRDMPLKPNDQLTFEVQINEVGDGSGRPTFWLYDQPARMVGVKGNCGPDRGREPACDSSVWGALKLTP